MTTAEQTEVNQIQKAWDDIAPGYDEYVTPTGNWELPEKALRLAGLQKGMNFLDVASGSGALSIPAARMGAQVLAADLSPKMIDLLHRRARNEGLSNLEGRVMDGYNLELNDNTFDIAGSQFGVMLFPDLPRGLTEMARVTKPGGRVLMVVYGPPMNVEFLGYFINAIQIVVPTFSAPPMDPPPLPFQVANPDILRQRMNEAGFKDIAIEPGIERLTFRTGKEMWDWVTNSNPIPAQMISNLTEEQKVEVQLALDDMLRERASGKAVAVLEAEVNIGIGTKRQDR